MRTARITRRIFIVVFLIRGNTIPPLGLAAAPYFLGVCRATLAPITTEATLFGMMTAFIEPSK
jgi:hypothetical protein